MKQNLYADTYKNNSLVTTYLVTKSENAELSEPETDE